MIVYMLISLLPIAICAGFTMIYRKKDALAGRKKTLTRFFVYLFAVTALLCGIIFELTSFYPIELKYDFLRVFLILSVLFLVLESASFVAFCVSFRADKKSSEFALLWTKLTGGKASKENAKAQDQKETGKEELPFKKRLAFAAIPIFGMLYMVTFFGITETFFANRGEWVFTFKDIVFPGLLIFFGTGILFSVLAAALKGRVYERVVIVIGSAFAGLYIQNAFLNTVKFINGEKTITPVGILILNIAIWGILLCVPLILYSKFKKKTTVFYVALAVSAILFGIQIAPLPFLFKPDPNAETQEANGVKKELRLSGEEQFVLSDEENVIVLIMDAFWNGYMDEYLENHPEAYEKLADFTYYDNMSTMAMNTSTSMPYLLTASDIDFSVDLRESNRQAWTGENATAFYDTLHEKGYTINLYTDGDNYCGDADNMVGKIDNVQETEFTVQTNSFKTYAKMLKLSLYKYVPFAFKEFVTVAGSEEINNCSEFYYNGVKEENSDDWTEVTKTAYAFGIASTNFDYQREMNERLEYTSGKRAVFAHIMGMHGPHYGSSVDEEVTQQQEEEICMNLLYSCIEKLKEQGVYENTSIIVTADHGYFDLYKSAPMMLVKGMGSTGEKLAISSAPGVVQMDLLPTILDLIGENPEMISGGKSILRLEDGEQRLRITRQMNNLPEFPPAHKCDGVGFSIYNCFEEYQYYGRTSDIDVNKDLKNRGPIVSYWW